MESEAALGFRSIDIPGKCIDGSIIGSPLWVNQSMVRVYIVVYLPRDHKFRDLTTYTTFGGSWVVKSEVIIP